jgi:hypothetical protein
MPRQVKREYDFITALAYVALGCGVAVVPTGSSLAVGTGALARAATRLRDIACENLRGASWHISM